MMNPYSINPLAAARNAAKDAQDTEQPVDPSKNPAEPNGKAPSKVDPKVGVQPGPQADVPTKENPEDMLNMDEMMKEVSWSETDVLQSYLPFGNNPDPIVKNKGLKIYREMMQDEQVKVCVDVRIQARLSTPWEIVPGEPGNSQSEEMADFIREVLQRMRGNFETDMEQIYSAITYGFSVSEKVFDYIDNGRFKGKIGLKAIKTREPYNYDFKIDSHGNLEGLIYIGMSGKEESGDLSNVGYPLRMNGQGNSLSSIGSLIPSRPAQGGRQPMGSLENPFAPEKFIIYAYNPQFGNWYGRSDLLAAFKWWLMKKHGSKFWAVWLERYASPFIWATYKRDAGLKPAQLTAVDDFIRNLSARQGIRLSDAWTLNPVQFNSQNADSYEKSIEAYNRYIAHAILFPNLLGFTGGQGSSGGSYSLGQKQFDSFMWILNKMGRDMSETVVGEQIIKQMIEINYGDVDQNLHPKFRFVSIEDSSIDVRSQIIQRLAQVNMVNPEEDWIRDFLTLPKKDPSIVLQPSADLNPDGTPKDPNAKNPDGTPKDPNAKDPNAKDPNAKPGDSKPAAAEPDKNKNDQNPPGDQKKMSEFKEREPDQFEKKMKVKQFREDLVMRDAGLFQEASSAIADIRDEIIDQVERKKLVTNDDPKDINRLAVNTKDLKDIFAKWMVKTFLDSKLAQLEEIGRAGVQVEIVRKFAALGSTVSSEWEPLPPQEAVDFFKRKVAARLIDQNGKKILIDIAAGIDLQFFQQRAFTIAGIVRDDILNDAKQILLNGIKRQDQAGTVKTLKDMFNKYLDQGIEVDEELLSPHRLNTIVRTNITEAVNEGRASMMTDPAVQTFVQFFQYTAIIDERTTDYCNCMDGKIFRIEDLDFLKPPAHFNCRSFTVPITQFEIQDLKKDGRGVEIAQPCPDRMAGFADLKREPVQVNLPTDEAKPIPTVVPKKVIPAVQTDIAPAQKTAGDIAATDKLKRELLEIVARCPYSFCGSDKIRFTGRRMNVGDFLCDSCQVPFRISSNGDIYLYDAGTDEWSRTSIGSLPGFFKEGVKLPASFKQENK